MEVHHTGNPINVVTDNAPHAGRGITIFLKSNQSFYISNINAEGVERNVVQCHYRKHKIKRKRKRLASTLQYSEYSDKNKNKTTTIVS